MSALTELLTRRFGSIRAARLAVLKHLPTTCTNRSKAAQRIDSTLAGSYYLLILAVLADLVGAADLQAALNLDAQRKRDEKDSWSWKFFNVELRTRVEHGLSFRPPSCVSFDRILRLRLRVQVVEALRLEDWETVLSLVRQAIDIDQADIPADRTRLFGATVGYLFRSSVPSFITFDPAGAVVGGASDLAVHRLGLRLVEIGLVERIQL